MGAPPGYQYYPHSQPDPQGYGGPPGQQMTPVMTQPAAGQPSTTVIINQPATTFQPRAWSSSLFGCCEDVPVCMCVMCCGLCAACQLSQDLGEHMCVPCCIYDWLLVLRVKLRTQEHIQGTVMDDCCTITCCGACVMCQMMREVKLLKSAGRLRVQ